MRRKLTTMFAVLLVLCFSWSLPVSAAGPLPKNTYSAPSLIYGGRDYSPVFNAQYYLSKYEDLRKAFGSDEARAFSHFLKNGMKEGRRASENFDVRYYRDQYPDLARRFYGKSTPYTLEFCFFDGEEFRGYAGSNIYLALCDHPEDIVLYVNIDCVGAGDLMYAYGGIYNDAGALTWDWGLQMTFALADELSIPLPYVYFEANRITYEDGSVIDEQRPHYLNTLNAAFQDTNGQIIHTKYDDLSKLEALLPGVIKDHLSKFSRLITALLTRADTSSPAAYSGKLSPAELIKRYSPLASGASEPGGPSGPEDPSEPEEPSDFDAGRYSLVFDADYYLDKYPDLRAAYGTDKARAFKHFLRNGMKEARQASAKFNVQVYRARYRDLDQAFGNNWTLYYEHYINNGYRENRTAY